jgi:hypothetical protein
MTNGPDWSATARWRSSPLRSSSTIAPGVARPAIAASPVGWTRAMSNVGTPSSLFGGTGDPASAALSPRLLLLAPLRSRPDPDFHRPDRSENRSRRWAGTVSDESKFLGILHFAQRDHHGVPFYRVVLGERKVHAIGQHVDNARAAPLAAAKNIPKLIGFDFLHGILRPLVQ